MRRIRRGTTLPIIKPNAGLRVAYRRRMDALIKEMVRDVRGSVFDILDGREGRLAYDALMPLEPQKPRRKNRTVAEMMQDRFNKLYGKWSKRFDTMARKQAPQFIKGISSRIQSERKKALREAGISIRLDTSRVTNEWYQAAIQYNVTLIKSIPEEYLTSVNESVMQSITAGFDRYELKMQLYDVLKDKLGRAENKALNRARIIARDQSHKATQELAMHTDIDLGITRGKWVHIPGQKTSRITHIHMDGKEFDIREGLYDSAVKRKVKPGELILCACSYRSVIPQDWI